MPIGVHEASGSEGHPILPALLSDPVVFAGLQARATDFVFELLPAAVGQSGVELRAWGSGRRRGARALGDGRCGVLSKLLLMFLEGPRVSGLLVVVVARELVG